MVQSDILEFENNSKPPIFVCYQHIICPIPPNLCLLSTYCLHRWAAWQKRRKIWRTSLLSFKDNLMKWANPNITFFSKFLLHFSHKHWLPCICAVPSKFAWQQNWIVSFVRRTLPNLQLRLPETKLKQPPPKLLKMQKQLKIRKQLKQQKQQRMQKQLPMLRQLKLQRRLKLQKMQSHKNMFGCLLISCFKLSKYTHLPVNSPAIIIISYLAEWPPSK